GGLRAPSLRRGKTDSFLSLEDNPRDAALADFEEDVSLAADFELRIFHGMTVEPDTALGHEPACFTVRLGEPGLGDQAADPDARSVAGPAYLGNLRRELVALEALR